MHNNQTNNKNFYNIKSQNHKMPFSLTNLPDPTIPFSSNLWMNTTLLCVTEFKLIQPKRIIINGFIHEPQKVVICNFRNKQKIIVYAHIKPAMHVGVIEVLFCHWFSFHLPRKFFCSHAEYKVSCRHNAIYFNLLDANLRIFFLILRMH